MRGYCLRVEKFGTGVCNRPEHCTECGAWVTADEIKTESPNLPKIDPLERAKKLANDHWEWLGGLFDRLDVEDSIGKYLYKTAFKHGYKHALEDIKSKEVIEPEGN